MAFCPLLSVILLIGFVIARPETRNIETSLRLGEVKHTLEPIDPRCGQSIQNVDNNMRILKSPGYPDDYPAGIQCQWIIKSTNPYVPLRIKFVEFDIGNPADCIGNHLKLSEQRKNKLITIGQFCGHLTPIYIQSPSEIIVSLNSTADHLSQPRKFMLAIDQIPCRRYHDLQQDKIEHSGLGECFITITAPANRTISLYFHHFVVEPSDDTVENFVKIYDGDFNSPVAHDISGVNGPNAIFSTGNMLSIHTRNSLAASYRAIMYDAYYTTTDKGRGCGGKIINNNGIITSPLYPHTYQEDSICKWEIKVSPGHQVSLEFDAFDLSASANCTANYLQIGDSEDNNNTIARFCGGSRLPSSLRTVSNTVNVIYVTSVDNAGTGWQMRYSAIASTEASATLV